MTNELSPLDISRMPELSQLAEEVRITGLPRRLRRNHQDTARLAPVASARRRRQSGRPTSAADPLWSIIGIGRSDGPADVSANKHTYLTEAYADTHDAAPGTA